jgi:hypothetical protein
MGKIQRKIEGFLEENEEGDDSMFLFDSAGQRLRLNVANTLGRGGQRTIIVYCPYWIVNTTQFKVKIREDGSIVLPAGSVTSTKDGSKPVGAPPTMPSFGTRLTVPSHTLNEPHTIPTDSSSGLYRGITSSGEDERAISGLNPPNTPHDNTNSANNNSPPPLPPRGHIFGDGTCFPGCKPALHNTYSKEIPLTSMLCELLRELPFEEIVDLACMFNYNDDERLLFNRKVVVQLDSSEWSKPFNLDSVGVNQVLKVDQLETGSLEIGFNIKIAPGRLAKYTKVVRLMPRFTVVNKLASNIKLMQPTGFGGESLSVPLSARNICLYHLPDVYADRKVAIQLEESSAVASPWCKTVAFNIDEIGTFILHLCIFPSPNL